jgi:hypothetical protein
MASLFNTKGDFSLIFLFGRVDFKIEGHFQRDSGPKLFFTITFKAFSPEGAGVVRNPVLPGIENGQSSTALIFN